MESAARITYRDFYDVPRIFIVHHRGLQILFDCQFDKNLDEYREDYKIIVLPDLDDESLKGSWNELSEISTVISAKYR